MRKVFIRFHEIDNWKYHCKTDDEWYACDRLDALFALMDTDVRDMFGFIDELHPMGIKKSALAELGIEG